MNEILAALIGGIATLLAALIALKREKPENGNGPKGSASWKVTGLFVIGCFAGGLLFAVIERNLDTTLFAFGIKMTPGTILAYAGPMSPKNKSDLEEKGWLLCDGSLVDKTDKYKALYEAIGDDWGPGDASEFRLPDLQGMFLRGVDERGKNDPDYANRVDGRGIRGPNVGSVQQDALQEHTHMLSHVLQNVQGSVNMHGDGGGQALETGPVFKNEIVHVSSETRPKNAYVYYIIKY